MSLIWLRRAPKDGQWDSFHFQHYIDHKQILAVVSQKTGTQLFMPPIWPVPGNDFDAKIAEFHQVLHQQMNFISGSPTSDMTQVDLSTSAGVRAFIEPNYRDHLAFHTLVGVPA